MPRKHVIYIHGRAPKPKPSEFADVIRTAMNTGLRLEHSRRNLGGAAKSVPDPAICGPATEPGVSPDAPLPMFHNTNPGNTVFTIAYYGDITGQLMSDEANEQETFADKFFWRLLAKDYKKWLDDPDALGHRYDKPQMAQTMLAELQNLVSYDGTLFSKRHWKQVQKDADPGASLMFDNLGRGLDQVLRLPWLGRQIEDAVRPRFPDLYAYLKMRYFGSDIRLRLQSVLLGALADGDEICLIGHSLGTLVSYDVLWKIGWMSEYKAFRDAPGSITQWVTLGSPLGWSVVQPYLYDGSEFESFRFPRNVEGTWHNIAAEDDPIAYDQTLKDDFAALEGRKTDLFDGKTKIRDHKIYNPCFSPVRESGGTAIKLDPHAEVGYLAHRETAGLLTKWLS